MMTFGLEQRHPVLKDFGVFGSRLREVFSDEHFGLLRSRWLWKAGEQEDVQKKGRKREKKEIIEDKNGYQFGIIILIT